MTTTEEDPYANRRKHARIENIPVFCQPTELDSILSPLINIGLGGMRVYSDKALEVGQHMDIELFLPDESKLPCRVEIAWLRTLEDDDSANYDVGFKFLEISEDGLLKLADLLEQDL